MKLSSVHTTALILFLALCATYICLSPGSIAGQGYAAEEIDSGLHTLTVVNAFLKGKSAPPMVWSRHGLVSVLFDLPFLKVGKKIISPDFMLSFSPVLFTAGLLTVLFLWLRKLCSPAMSLFLVLAAAFGTMLWPYAYIGLETKQSFFILLAGYMGLACGKIRTWPRLLLFGLACAFAITVKSTGITLWPVIAYLVYVQFRDDWRTYRARFLVIVLLIAGIWILGKLSTNAYWAPRGGGAGSFRTWLIDSPLQLFVNVVGLFGSPTKGLFIYAPVLIASLYAVPRVFRENRQLAMYTLLVTACTVGLVMLLTSPADEVWGCRYLHIAIAPLILCIGAAWPRFNWRVHAPILLLAVLGIVVSFLGAFYYYGIRDFAMTEARQNTLEWVTGDQVWNQVQFNARLLHVWLFTKGNEPVLWTPNHLWVWAPPPDAPPWKSIDLRQYCQPQSFMVRFWHTPKSGVVSRIFAFYLTTLIIGVVLLGWSLFRTVQEQAAEQRKALALDTAPAAL